MPPFNRAVALRIVGRCAHRLHLAQPNKILEVTGDELQAIVTDDPGIGLGILLPRLLQDDFLIAFVMAGRISQWMINRL